MRISPAHCRATDHRRGVLTRLRGDASGTTMAMMAMATIPLAGMAGSAIDIGRGYLVRARLQQACDAGALAARRSMVNNTLDPASVTQARNYFQTNFVSDTAGATGTAFNITGASSGEVTGTATTRVPMTVTRILGKDFVDLNVTCSARLEIPNTDVMFVLDTTGSMNCIPSDVNSTGTCDGGSTSKIAGIRSAVLDFYDTMAASIPPGAQLRYGFVPYSSTVNVGATLSSSWVPTDWTYRSRVANFTTRVDPTNAAQSQRVADAAACSSYQSNINYPGSPNRTSNASTDAAGFTTTLTVSASGGFNSGAASPSPNCSRNINTTVSPTAYKFTNFTYQSESYDLSTFKTGAAVNVATGTPADTVYVAAPGGVRDMVQLAAMPTYTGSEESTTWGGCIEERNTVANATFAYGSIPSGAYDLDLDALPSVSQTMWRPWWPQVVYRNDGWRPFDAAANGYAACPSPARKMAVMTRSAVQTYVNALAPIGGTYHDTGMIWGARLLSPTGIFASENATAPNGQPINRNIIFMTDGQMAPNQNIYGLYGLEANDQRVSAGNFSELTARHNSRFRAMCDAARAKNMRVWVIGFGTALSTDMTACADPNQAFQASDTATLRARFAQIAAQVARLRLSK